MYIVFKGAAPQHNCIILDDSRDKDETVEKKGKFKGLRKTVIRTLLNN